MDDELRFHIAETGKGTRRTLAAVDEDFDDRFVDEEVEFVVAGNDPQFLCGEVDRIDRMAVTDYAQRESGCVRAVQIRRQFNIGWHIPGHGIGPLFKVDRSELHFVRSQFRELGSR